MDKDRKLSEVERNAISVDDSRTRSGLSYNKTSSGSLQSENKSREESKPEKCQEESTENGSQQNENESNEGPVKQETTEEKAAKNAETTAENQEETSEEKAATSNENVAEINEASSSDESDVVPTHDSTGRAFYRRLITLYHYTTRDGARSIERDQRIRQNNEVSGRQRHRMHGEGVYFTSWDPGRRSKRDLIDNLFVRSTSHLRNENVFYDRIQSIVKVEFDENDPIVKVNDGARDLFVHRGDVNLRNYEGRYRIYDNPNAP